MRHIRLELKSSQEPRDEPTQHGITFGRGDEEILIRDLGDSPDDRQDILEPLHADLAIDYGDAVLAGLLSLLERSDGAAKQQQCLRHIAFGSRSVVRLGFVPW